MRAIGFGLGQWLVKKYTCFTYIKWWKGHIFTFIMLHVFKHTHHVNEPNTETKQKHAHEKLSHSQANEKRSTCNSLNVFLCIKHIIKQQEYKIVFAGFCLVFSRTKLAFNQIDCIFCLIENGGFHRLAGNSKLLSFKSSILKISSSWILRKFFMLQAPFVYRVSGTKYILVQVVGCLRWSITYFELPYWAPPTTHHRRTIVTRNGTDVITEPLLVFMVWQFRSLCWSAHLQQWYCIWAIVICFETGSGTLNI